jgi:hypothetical protein
MKAEAAANERAKGHEKDLDRKIERQKNESSE